MKQKKIRDDASQQIKAEKDRAISDIKKEVVDLSISVAEKLINKNISEKDNSSLIEESLKEIKQYEA
jgi:F-type H+-transporting ATPase subunit b